MSGFAFLGWLGLGPLLFGKGQGKASPSPTTLVPAGYRVVEAIQGDLNGDHRPDVVFLVKAKHGKGERGAKAHRDRRGLLIVLSQKDGFALALEHPRCFSSGEADGGVYLAPELNISVARGVLRLHFSHGRYGFSAYQFRYQNGDFELIGYDQSEQRGPVVERSISINLLTRKLREQRNVNPKAEGDDEVFQESWQDLQVPTPFRLREIADFEAFDLPRRLGVP